MEVSIEMLGDKALERKLHKLTLAAQLRVIRPVVRTTMRMARARSIRILKGHKRTGNLIGAMRATKPKTKTTRLKTVQAMLPMPTRDLLGIATNDPYYYPAALEYGHGAVPPYSFIRAALDEDKAGTFARMRRDIATGIEREAMRL